MEKCWLDIPNHFSRIALDAYVIMPNHIHGILNIAGARHAVPSKEAFGKPASESIPTAVRSFKSAVTKRVNESRKSSGQTVWQRNYWEHVVRDEIELNQLREYIHNNPMKWVFDTLYLSDSL